MRAGLLWFRRSVRDAFAQQSHHLLVAKDIQIFVDSLEARWSFGICAENVLSQCVCIPSSHLLIHPGTLL